MHDTAGGMRRFVAALAAAMLTCAAADLIKVGGKDGWKPSVNYTHWAAHRRFYVGDWLYFVFNKHYYNVLEVKRSNYESCDDSEFINNITRGGRDVYNLTEARSYYFLSSGGYCFHGMKLSIHVRHPPPPPPAAPDVKTAESGGSLGTGPDRAGVVLLLLMAAFSTFTFKILWF